MNDNTQGLTDAELATLARARHSRLALTDEQRAAVTKIKADAYAAGLAARGDAATDDDALRERIEAWLATQVDSLGGGFHLVRMRDLLAVLDAAPAPTEGRN